MLNGKKTVFSMLTMFLIVTASSIGCAVNILQSTAEKSQDAVSDSQFLDYNITIPDDYSTIQEGIDNAKSGDVIFVRSGVYKENIVVDKEGLTIVGENNVNTVIDCSKTTEDAVAISARNVKLMNFTITNADSGKLVDWDQAGIKINASNTEIVNNRITYNRVGIIVYTPARNLNITGNEFINDGILLGEYFESHTIDFSDFVHIIRDNTVNGKRLYYIQNQHDYFEVPVDAGQIILVNCSNVTIKNMYMENNDFSIILAYCNNCIIENSTIANTNGEILVFSSENCTIQNNLIVNTLKAICLEYQSKNNIVRNNIVTQNYVGISMFSYCNNNLISQNEIYDNDGAGIEIVSFGFPGYQHDNVISDNNIYNNRYGIRLYRNSSLNIIQKNMIKCNRIGIIITDSSDNTIQNNTFKKNPISAVFTECSTNNWSHNFWKRPRILPKMIFGFRTIGNIPIPWVNIDRHPARQPTV